MQPVGRSGVSYCCRTSFASNVTPPSFSSVNVSVAAGILVAVVLVEIELAELVVISPWVKKPDSVVSSSRLCAAAKLPTLVVLLLHPQSFISTFSPLLLFLCFTVAVVETEGEEEEEDDDDEDEDEDELPNSSSGWRCGLRFLTSFDSGLGPGPLLLLLLLLCGVCGV